MYYIIKSASKGTWGLFLAKKNNYYVVSDYDTVTEKVTIREEFERFDEADPRFLSLCEEYGVKPENVEHDNFY